MEQWNTSTYISYDLYAARTVEIIIQRKQLKKKPREHPIYC